MGVCVKIYSMIFGTAIALGAAAGLVQFVGYFIYVRDVVRSHIKPNPASWLIWSYGNALVCLSYIFLNQRFALSIEILPIVCGVACIVSGIIFLFIGKFRPIEGFEKKVVIFDLLVVLIWALDEFFGFRIMSLFTLHVLLLVSTVVAFIPVYKDVFEDPSVERPRAWIIWAVAYLILLIVSFMERGDIFTILYPALYAMLHGLVAVLASKKLL